jgi:hypothetical protein
MSVEFFGSCSDKKIVSLKKFIEYLENQDFVKSVYGPFGEEGEQMAFLFPENSIRGFSVQVSERDTNVEFSFRQNILPNLSDWQTLLSALQFLVQLQECDIRDEDNQLLDHDILEQWKSEEVYHERHLFEAHGIVEQLRTEDDEFTFPTFPFDLKVYRKDIDFNVSIEEQFDRIIKILEKQVEHYASCYIPSIVKISDKSDRKHSMIVWTPTISTLAWEVDWISLTEMSFGENKVICFQDLLDILGDRVKQIGSIAANSKRVELPVLDFKKSQDQQLKIKILALKSTL